MSDIRPRDVLDFWFKDTPSEKRFATDAALDAQIRARFEDTWRLGCAGGLKDWENEPNGALALIVLFDQFPRNMFRGQARTYATDAAARAVADRALRRCFDRQVPQIERQFFYLPFMHSEDGADQERCLELARGYGDDEFTRYAEQHAGIVRRFGRFPHRNAALGQISSPEEQAFLDAGGFAG
jgi:uncharacterized protein (DUF924 family)